MTAPALTITEAEQAEAVPTARGGHPELGRITVSDRVVEKIAARAALEVAEAGGAAPRILGRSVPAAQQLGLRHTGLDSLPKTSADTDATLTFLDITLSVRWPTSIQQVTQAVRTHVAQRVEELTGRAVAELNITVAALVRDLDPGRRVQ